jgi:hypothetical protein
VKTYIYIEDHVVPQLFTSAIEAYEIEHRSSTRAKGQSKLETFGLLWGYTIPASETLPSRIIATNATVETSALRHEDWVAPDFESILSKKEFFEKYWPNIILIGSFHSHPYNNHEEVKNNKGWRGSETDIKSFWPHFHELIAPEQERLAHIVIAITRLSKKGWAYPDHLKNDGEYEKGYSLTAAERKLWLRGYSSIKQVNGEGFETSDDIKLVIPSLERRFNQNIN